MKETKTMNDIHKKLIKRLHTLYTLLGVTRDEQLAIYEGYGVESSRDMDTHDLLDVIARLDAQACGETHEMDLLRKRTFASVGAYLRAVGREESAELIKAIACRATGHAAFNRIPKERLRNVIATFNDKVRDLREIERMTRGMTVPFLTRAGGGVKS